MSNGEEILREAIMRKCGLGGLMRFNAIYAGSFEKDDGTPDFPGIMRALSNVFPADQATAIAAVVADKLHAGGPSPDGQGAADATGGSNPSIADSPVDEGRGVLPVYARLLDADPNHVRDIVNEARRVRAALGKSTPSLWAPHTDKVIAAAAGVAKVLAEEAAAVESAAEAAPVERTPEAKPAAAGPVNAMAMEKPLPEEAPERPAQPRSIPPAQALDNTGVRLPGRCDSCKPAQVIAEPVSVIDGEIERFAYGRTTYTSIDIMDFIRYLKDKGYSFQEYIVLEKIYVRIEERKKEARSAIEKEVEGLIDATQAPAEPDIRGFFGRLIEAGLVFEEADVRRMIRGAILRRA